MASKQFDWVQKGDGWMEITSPKDTWGTWHKCDQERETIYSKVRDQSLERPAQDFLGWREPLPAGTGRARWSPYRFISYGEGFEQIAAVGSALVQLGMARGDMCAIFAPNCPQWIICEFGMFRQSICTVPLYATFGRPALSFILDQTQLQTAFVAASLIGQLLEALEGQAPETRALRNAIVMSGPGRREADDARAAALGLKLIPWDDMLSMGRASPVPEAAPAPEDLHTVMYTSGTTGNPKGVITTHRAALSNSTKGLGHHLTGGAERPWEHRHFSYLPLAHCAERSMVGVFLRVGATIGFASGNPALLLDDMEKFRPTTILGVPRVWKRIYDKVEQSIDEGGFIKRTLFRQALATKAAVEAGSWSLIDWDKVIFSKVAQKIGGNCKFILNGAAPLKADLWLWMQRVFLAEVAQSYGMTESYGAVTVSPWQKLRPTMIGSVGLMCPESTMRLVDTPELGYSTSNAECPAGEIWLKGPSITKGYYKEPKLTAEALSEDGWLHTGDVGRLNPDGSISIIDRVKNLFKLAQGEYVPGELIEALLSGSKLAAQVWVHGESTENFIIALCVPNLETICSMLQSNPKFADLCAKCVAERYTGPAGKTLCELPETHDLIVADFDRISKDAKLPGFQCVRAVGIESDPWTVENGLATPTFKLKRVAMRERFKERIQQLYVEVRAKAN